MRRTASVLVVLLLAPVMVLLVAEPARAMSSVTAQPANVAILTDAIAEGVISGTVPETATSTTGGASGTATATGKVAKGTGITGKVRGALRAGELLMTIGGLSDFFIGRDTESPDIELLPTPPGAAYGPGVEWVVPGSTFKMRGQALPTLFPANIAPGGGTTNYYVWQVRNNTGWDNAGAAWLTAGEVLTPGWTKTCGAGPTHVDCWATDAILRLIVRVYDGPGPATKDLVVHEGPVTAGPVDPLTAPRTIEQTVTCKRPDGSSHTVTSSTPFTVDGAGDFLTEVLGLMCPVGDVATAADVAVKTPGVADVVPLTPTLQPDPKLFDPAHVPEECLTGAACSLDLTYPQPGLDPDLATTPRVSCFNGKDTCVDWADDPNRNKIYQCRFGKGLTWVVRPLAECLIYVDIFRTPGPNTPKYDPPPEPNSCQFGWSDVLNGGIVLKAVKCALTWAFVPRESWLQGLRGKFSDAWNPSAPRVALGIAASWSAPFGALAGDSAGCDGPSLSITLPGGHTLLNNSHPFSTCHGLSAWAVAWFKPLLAALALFGTVGMCARMIVSSFWTGAVMPGDRKPAAVPDGD